jgi:hypothetical protein
MSYGLLEQSIIGLLKNGGRQWHGAETRQDRILMEKWLLAIIAMPV